MIELICMFNTEKTKCFLIILKAINLYKMIVNN